MKDKKKRERMILECVYNESRFRVDSRECEQPDFKVYDTVYKSTFGVEVTELYKNQMSAKSQNGKNLKPAELLKPTKEEYIDILCERVKHKNKKIEKYDMTLDYINLIIYDMEQSFFDFGFEKIIDEIICNSLEKNILISKFNEIFIVSKKGIGCKILPLKLSVIRKEINFAVRKCRSLGIQKEEMKVRIAEELLRNGIENLEYVRTEHGKSYKLNDYLFSLDEWEMVRKATQTEYVYGGNIDKGKEHGLKEKYYYEETHGTWNVYPPIIL